MVVIESLMKSCAIDTREEVDGSAVKISGEFVQRNMQGNVVGMKIEGKWQICLPRLVQTCTASTL